MSKNKRESKFAAFNERQKIWKQALRRQPKTKANPSLYIFADILAEHFDWSRYDCFPSRETIADEMGGVDVSTVSRLAKALAEMGFIRIKRQGPKRPSLYVMTMPEDVAAVQYQESGLDVAAPQSKMLQRCDTNYFKEPTGEPLKRRRPEIDSSSHQSEDEENLSQSGGSRLDAEPPLTGEDGDTPSEVETIFPEADEVDLDSCPNVERPDHDNLDGPHTGDQIDIGEGAFAPIVEENGEAVTETPEEDEWGEPLEGTDADYSEVLPFDSLGPDQSSPQIDIRHGQQN